MAEFIPAVKNASEFSVSGSFQDLTIVGRDASPSAIIAKRIASIASFVIIQAIIPNTENDPHIMSNLHNFHSDFLLKNEATNINNGIIRTEKVSTDSKPTPSCI